MARRANAFFQHWHKRADAKDVKDAYQGRSPS